MNTITSSRSLRKTGNPSRATVYAYCYYTA
jgi:hypothetical protein